VTARTGAVLVALAVVPLAAANHTGDRWEGTWRVSPTSFATTLVLRPSTAATTRAQAPPCVSPGTLYAGAYSGGRTGTVAACARRFELVGRLYESGRRVGDLSLTWSLAVLPDGTLGSPTFDGTSSIGGSRAVSGTWLRHGGNIPTTTRKPGSAAQRAAAVARAVVERNARACKLKIVRATARSLGGGRWRVTVRVVIGGSATDSIWIVVGRRVTAGDPLAAEIEHGCP
jgi:hypothetical protein